MYIKYIGNKFEKYYSQLYNHRESIFFKFKIDSSKFIIISNVIISSTSCYSTFQFKVYPRTN